MLVFIQIKEFMKKTLVLTFYLLVAVSISACVTNTESTFVNDKGEKRYCYLANTHTITSMGAVSEYTRCMNEAGALGFKKLN